MISTRRTCVVRTRDLNAFTTFFDSVLWPVIGVNQYAPARADAPHRLLARGRAMPTKSWLFVGVLDWRTGLPYSVVNETLDFVGTRNDHRFPNYLRLELGVERRIRLLKFRPWVGVAADNALNASADRRAGEHGIARFRILLHSETAIPHPVSIRR